MEESLKSGYINYITERQFCLTFRPDKHNEDYTTEKHTMNQIWLEPWGAVSESQKEVLRNELQAEVTFHHPLFGLQLEPIGRNFANDDVLFTGEGNKLVAVHLTWSGAGDQRYPSTEFFDTWSEFTDKKMVVDNLGY